jgi:hypothetical protein
MSRTSGRCFASQERSSSRSVVQRRWCWRLRVSWLTACTRSRINSNRRRTPRRLARLFNSTFVVAFQAANTASEKRRARKRQRHGCAKQHRHHSKQSQTAFHEPVPPTCSNGISLTLQSEVASPKSAQEEASSSIVGSFGRGAAPITRHTLGYGNRGRNEAQAASFSKQVRAGVELRQVCRFASGPGLHEPPKATMKAPRDDVHRPAPELADSLPEPDAESRPLATLTRITPLAPTAPFAW